MGSFFGALIARGRQGRSRSRVLAFEGGLLTLAALASWTGHKPVAIGLMVMAMAAENSVFLRNGEVAVSLTYMTGTLVKLGKSLIFVRGQITTGERLLMTFSGVIRKFTPRG